MRVPLIAAHRGSSGKAPENTLAAFELAVAEGADMIELDVRMTRDFELVVLHDRTVNRTTNGNGFVWKLTRSELHRLDTGSWFDAYFASQRIPTLHEVVDFLPAHLQLNIEVKTDGDTRRRSSCAKQLATLLRKKKLLSRVIVSSFDHAFLARLHSFDSTIPVGVLYMAVRDMAKKPSSLARKVGATLFVCSVAQLKKRIAEDVKKNNITLGCYGVNTRPQLEKALRHGVDIVITDYPKEMRAMMREFGRESAA